MRASDFRVGVLPYAQILRSDASIGKYRGGLRENQGRSAHSAASQMH